MSASSTAHKTVPASGLGASPRASTARRYTPAAPAAQQACWPAGTRPNTALYCRLRTGEGRRHLDRGVHAAIFTKLPLKGCQPRLWVVQLQMRRPPRLHLLGRTLVSRHGCGVRWREGCWAGRAQSRGLSCGGNSGVRRQRRRWRHGQASLELCQRPHLGCDHFRCCRAGRGGQNEAPSRQPLGQLAGWAPAAFARQRRVTGTDCTGARKVSGSVWRANRGLLAAALSLLCCWI